MTDRVPSSPYLFRPVVRALLIAVIALLLGAILVPAPLDVAADALHPPNPAKSAWFLIWIQELVSHGTPWIYTVVALAAALVGLPWLRSTEAEHAAWFQRGERLFAVAVLLLTFTILGLTVVGLFLRGANWQLQGPF